MKKSILFIADKRDWAYHNIIKTWEEYLSEEFECYIAFAEDFALQEKKFSFAEKVFYNTLNCFRKKDLKMRIDASGNYSYPVYRNPPVYTIENDEQTDRISFDIIIEMAYYFQYYSVFPFLSEKKLVGLFTDSFPHEGPSYDRKKNIDLKTLSREHFYTQYLKNYDGIIVGNTNLLQDYAPFSKKTVFANGIYRQKEFVENKHVGEKEGLVLGWTGNPNRTMKGFKEIIVPAVDKVKETGRKVSLKTQFTGSYDSVLSFYQDVDVVLIASNADTGPSLFAEASLASVPSVSTEIGFPKMVIRNKENGIFVKRDITELADAIIQLYDDRALLKNFSKRIKQDYLQVLSNEKMAGNLLHFLKNKL